MSGMVANRLLKNWLSKTELQQGELRSALMLYEENEETHLVSVTLKINDEGKIEVARVLQNINIDDAFWCHFRVDILQDGLLAELYIETARVDSLKKSRPFVAG